ncbi:MAG TPA: hypothetical protein VJL90_03005 [Pseudorhodoplanes sp.]|nr:hypothetical protein [Pseudorhodoplanes sp.]
MHYPDLMMNSRTLRMAEDTATLHHRYLLTVAAVMVLDWPSIRAVLPASLRLRGMWDAADYRAMDDRVADFARCLSKHSQWLDQQFRDFPAYLRDLAIRSAAFRVCDVRVQRPSEKSLLIDFLTDAFSERPEVCIWMNIPEAKEIAKQSLPRELKLFDRDSCTWVWRRIVTAKDGIPYNGESSVDEEEEMIKASPENAEMRVASMGVSVTLRSSTLIPMQSILDAIPFSASEIPESFWTWNKLSTIGSDG